MNKWFHLVVAFFICFSVKAQLSINECYEKARQNYPYIKMYDLIGKSSQYNLSNASRGYLPQITLSAKATYQSDVTSLPISLPGVQFPEINKDQYQVLAEVNQNIWDGGIIKSKKQQIEAEHTVDRMKYEVEIYAIYEKINDIFFSILLIDEQLSLTDIYVNELRTNYDKVNAYVRNGIANQADLDAVSVELLNTSQQKAELIATREAYSKMLAYFIGESEESKIQVAKPDVDSLSTAFNITVNNTKATLERPEIDLYNANIIQLETQRKSITANNLPKISAFIQGGYGNPGLNMLEEGFKLYAIGGIKFSWNFGNLYTLKNDLKNIENNIRKIHMQEDVFRFNTHLKTIRQNIEIQKYHKIMKDDDRIIQLRKNIKTASEAKVENGTLSVNDMVRDINAEQTARRNKAIHEIELIKSIYQLKNTLNK